MSNIYLIFEDSSIYLFAQKPNRRQIQPECHPISHSARLSDIWQGISIAISRKFSIFLAEMSGWRKAACLELSVQKCGKEQRNAAQQEKMYKKSLENKLLVLRFWRC